MDLSYVGPAIDDPEILARLPGNLLLLLKAQNGFIACLGALHVRGACIEPRWHSIRAAWVGELALYSLYPAVQPTDIPIAEDCFGDQFLLRDGLVLRLIGETGEIEATNLTWAQFLAEAESAPTEFLNAGYLRIFQQNGATLLPGQLLSVYPPFCTAECTDPSLRPVPALELRRFLADFAKQVSHLPNGQKISIKVR